MNFRTEPPRRLVAAFAEEIARCQPRFNPTRFAGQCGAPTGPQWPGQWLREPEVQLYDADANKSITVPEAEAAAGRMRYVSRQAAGKTRTNDFELGRERANQDALTKK